MLTPRDFFSSQQNENFALGHKMSFLFVRKKALNGNDFFQFVKKVFFLFLKKLAGPIIRRSCVAFCLAILKSLLT
jgi:hypothetical protein